MARLQINPIRRALPTFLHIKRHRRHAKTWATSRGTRTSANPSECNAGVGCCAAEYFPNYCDSCDRTTMPIDIFLIKYDVVLGVSVCLNCDSRTGRSQRGRSLPV